MNLLKKEIISINAAAFLIGAAGFLSRILGLFRDRLLAGNFGASRELDIYYAAFQIPDFIFHLFLIGAAAGAIIPVFLEYYERDKEEGESLISSLFNVFLFISAIFSALVILIAPFIINFLVPGFSDAEKQLTAYMTRLMMLSPFFLSLSNIISSVIQANRRFFAFALSSVFYNLGIIFGILVFLPLFGLVGLVYGVILGAFFHLAVQLPAFWGLGFSFSRKIKYHPGIKKIMSLSIPRVLAVSASSITLVFITAIASGFSPGSIAIFQFARNIYFIPVGIFGASLAVAVFPKLSESFIKKSAPDFWNAFWSTFMTLVFWLLPASVIFYVLRAHIVRLALGAGLFDWKDTRLTAAILGIFSLAIVFESASFLLTRAFYALNKTARPLVSNVAAALLVIVLSFFLADVFSEPENFFTSIFASALKVGDINDLSILGVALAFMLGQALNFFVMLKLFLKEVRRAFDFIPRDNFMEEVLILLGVSLFAGLTVYMFRKLLWFISLETFWGVFIQGGISAIAGILTYGFILYRIRNKEILNIIEVFNKKLIKTDVLPTELGNSHSG